MKKVKNTMPEHLEYSEDGTVFFNWNIVENNDLYEYDSVQVVGELCVSNIKYAMMLENYTDEEICEMENVKKTSTKKKDKEEYKTYKNLKDSYLNIILESVGDLNNTNAQNNQENDMEHDMEMHVGGEQQVLEVPMKVVYKECRM